VFLDHPQDDPNIRGDAFKTLIVARLSYDATEQDLESEFGRFGPIERVCCHIPPTALITIK
jgi:U1 small nuclear ribonucleoprotein